MKYNEHDFKREEETVRKYEQLLESGNSFFLSEEEMGDVINHYTYNDNFHKALQAIENSLKIYPYESEFYIRKADILSEMGKMKEALKAIDKGIALEPSNLENYIAKGNIYENFEEHTKAIEVFKDAIKLGLNPTRFIVKIAISYYYIEKYELAKSWIRKVNPKRTEDEVILIEIIFGFRILEMQNECVDFFRAYTDENPYSERAWYLLSQIYFEIQNYKRAIWAIDFALAIRDDFYDFWNYKGMYHFAIDEFYPAIDSYKKSIELEPEYSESYSDMGLCYLKLEDWQTARKYFKTALKYENDNAEAWAGIGSSYILQNKYTEAVHYLKKALKLSPYNDSYQLELAKSYFNLEKHQQAINIYKSVTSFNPNNIEAWLDWSYLCWVSGDSSEAFRKLHTGAQGLPPHADILYRMASYCFLNKKIKRGTELLEEALGLNFNKKDLFFKFAPEFKNSTEINELIDMYNPENYYK